MSECKTAQDSNRNADPKQDVDRKQDDLSTMLMHTIVVNPAYTRKMDCLP